MSVVVWYPLCILVAIALDWAFVERFLTSIEAFLGRSLNPTYRDGLFPRIILTVLGAVGFAHGTFREGALTISFWGGIFLFTLSVIWAVLISLRDDKNST